MSHQIEEKAERLVFDLNHSRAYDAANVLRQELQCDPREALSLIRIANQWKDPSSPECIVVQNGNVMVRDDWNGTQVYAGRLPGYGRDQDDCDDNWRYNNGRNDDWRYNNGNRSDDWRYHNRRDDDYNNGRNDDWRYNNGRNDDWRYNNGRNDDCDDYRYPVYRQPSIYIPDCYDNGRGRGNDRLGTGIAIGVVGGLILDQALNHNRNGSYRVRGSW